MTLTTNRMLHPTIQRLTDDALGVAFVYLGINMITPVPAATAIGAWLLLAIAELTGIAGPEPFRKIHETIVTLRRTATMQRLVDGAIGVTVVYLGINMITPVPWVTAAGAWLLLAAVELGRTNGPNVIATVRKRMANINK